MQTPCSPEVLSGVAEILPSDSSTNVSHGNPYLRSTLGQLELILSEVPGNYNPTAATSLSWRLTGMGVLLGFNVGRQYRAMSAPEILPRRGRG